MHLNLSRIDTIPPHGEIQNGNQKTGNGRAKETNQETTREGRNVSAGTYRGWMSSAVNSNKSHWYRRRNER